VRGWSKAPDGIARRQAGLAPGAAVNLVAEERVAGLGEVDADLVGAAGVEGDLRQRGRAAERLPDAPGGDRAPGGADLPGEPGPVPRMAAVRGVEGPLRRQAAVAQGEVGLLHRPPLPLRLQRGERGLGARHHQAAGGVPVQAVDEPEPRDRPAGRPEPEQEGVHQRGVGGAAGRVHDHPGRLVQDHQVPVLVEHRERQVLGHEAGGLGRRELHLDPLAAPQARRGAGAAPLQAHSPFLHQLLDAGPRERRVEPRQGDVEADPGELRPGDVAPALDGRDGRYQTFDFTCPLDFRITSTIARS